ncbi:MAG: efflux RND transporter permease subunit [Planctomycetes bacterium]|nr:efflux RND transporter permease subunit [Planctomycetota bacterium]
MERGGNALTSIVALFLEGKLAILLAALSLLLGMAAILITPREEEPQIVVPVVDIYVSAPGASAQEVEKLVATPLERLLWQIDGVEYVYSVSERGGAMVTVRYYVGEDREDSLVKLRNKLDSHIDQVAPIAKGWVIKPVEIDDVPIVTLTLHSATLDDHELRRVGEEVLARLDVVEDVSQASIVGGRSLEVRVEPDPTAMAALGVAPLELHGALAAADSSLYAGDLNRANQVLRVESGPFLRDAREVANLVVGVHEGRPVLLGDVARVESGPEEPTSYTRIGITHAGGAENEGFSNPAVTLALAKKRGTNAVNVADRILARMDEVREEVVPDGVEVRVTRNYGATADEKVDELLYSLLFAMVSVVGLLVFTLGWREGLIVALAVPISFALALAVNLIFGFTINRVTLFALILTLGLVVDDPITNVDNIQRHILAGKEEPRKATLTAVREVLPPVIMSTLTVIVSFLPMFFITGMMGPYMGPMAITVPLTVSFSTVAALSIVPWASYKLLKRRSGQGIHEEGAGKLLRVVYGASVRPFLRSRLLRWGLLFVVLALLGGSGLLVVTKRVPMKMLPFNNKDELQITIDMPEGTPLEATDAVARDFEHYLFTVPEITDFQAYVGTHSPIDFNGLVRHYYERKRENLADVRLNLAGKDERQQQSHEIALRIRDDLQAIADRHGARMAIVESPPGPPVLATLAGEVTGPPERTYAELLAAAELVTARMGQEPGLVDVDSMTEFPRSTLEFQLDREKASLHGVRGDTVTQTLALALTGTTPAALHRDDERQTLAVRLRPARADRNGREELGRIEVRAADGGLVPLAELGSFVEVPHDPPIYHKNLERVVFVTGEMAGRAPAEAVLDLQNHFKDAPLPGGIEVSWSGEGEWDITLRVFRDLGLAFGAALMGIYLLLVIQTNSFLMPMLIMTAIPLTAIGILPGFWLLNLVVDVPVGGYATPVFFTATAMIGMIALGGIVVRNSIVLIEFIQQAVAEGMSLGEAIIQSGAVRMRPILLTAATTALGAWPITLDPIFSGLAWALIFGLVASTAFTLIVVPVSYYAFFRKKVAA